MDHSNYINIDWLKNNHQMIHYFGLGFIQLKIDNSTRMHFYHPSLKPIVSDEEIHNHRYDFTSTIIGGSFEQELFDVKYWTYGAEWLFDEGVKSRFDHVKEYESCQENVQKEMPKGRICAVELGSKHKYSKGDSYFVSHKTFHRVKGDNCITLVKRSEYKKELAEVIRKNGVEKVCPFSVKIETEELWKIVEEMFQNWFKNLVQ